MFFHEHLLLEIWADPEKNPRNSGEIVFLKYHQIRTKVLLAKSVDAVNHADNCW